MASKEWFKLSALGKERTMQVQNFGQRVRSQRNNETMRNMAETVAIGLLLDGDNIKITNKGGDTVAEGVYVNNEAPLINEGGSAVNTMMQDAKSAWEVDTSDFGSLVSRNVLAHIAGPQVGTKNDLNIRGYADNETIADDHCQRVGARNIDLFAGINLTYDKVTDSAVYRYDTGAFTNTTDATACITNYDVGQTARMVITGPHESGPTGDENLASRTITWEFRTDTDPNSAASWTPKMQLTH